MTDEIDNILRDWFCNQAEGIIVETETGIQAIQAIINRKVAEGQIFELLNLVKPVKEYFDSKRNIDIPTNYVSGCIEELIDERVRELATLTEQK